MDIQKTLYWGVILIVIGILVVAGALQIISNNKCKSVCEGKGTPFYDVIHNGEWNTKDVCVCYFENEIEVSILK